MNWKMNSAILGLCVATVSPGLSVVNTPGAVTRERQKRAVAEMTVIGALSAHYTKSWWPLIGPLGYLAFDYGWSQYNDAVPKVGVSI